MKSLILSMFFLLPSVLIVAQNHTVTIIVDNIQIGQGSIVLNIYDKEVTFFKNPLITKSESAINSSMKIMFEAPIGTYAISIFQDFDNNGKLNQGWFGRPLEPVGFGNNFKPKFSAPSFQDCAVHISNSNTQFKISLN